MKKSELRQMIREMLREELSSKKYLKESKFDSEPSKAKNEDYSHLEPFECEHCGKKLFGDDYKMLYNPEQDYDEVVCYDCYDKASI